MNLVELLFISGLYTNGFLATSLILKKENRLFVSGVSLFTGISLFFFLFFAILLCVGKVTLLNIGILSFVVFSGFFSFYMYHSQNRLKDFLFFVAAVSIFTGIYMFFLNYDFNLFCGDTFHLTRCATKFSLQTSSFADNIKSLASWGAVFVLIQHLGSEIGIPYFFSLQIVLYLSFILTFCFVLFRSLDFIGVKRIICLTSSVLCSMILATSPIFLHVVLLLHTNAYLIYFLFLFFAFYFLGEISNKKNYHYISYLFLFTAAFTRVEAPIYCLIMVICILFGKKDKKLTFNNLKNKEETYSREQKTYKDKPFESEFFNVTVGFCVLMGVWYTFLYLLGVDSDILSKNRAIFLSGLYFLIPITLTILNFGYLKIIKNNFFNLVYIFSFIVITGSAFLFHNDFMSSLTGMHQNFSTHHWKGVLFFMYVVLAFNVLMSILLKKKESFVLEKAILTSIILIILSIISFSFFRQPFYRALYDSSNRLFVMLIPIVIFYLSIKFHSLSIFLSPQKLEKSTE